MDDFEDDWDDEDDFDLDEDEDGPSGQGDTYEDPSAGPAHTPMWTGLLTASGEPILRHPVVMRVGFHPQRNQYHAPTLEEGDYETSERVAGWVYDT